MSYQEKQQQTEQRARDQKADAHLNMNKKYVNVALHGRTHKRENETFFG